MLNRFFVLVFAVFVLQACSSGSENESSEIDYATLDSLQTEVVLEIGESDDFLPGQLNSLVVTPEGGMLVSDWASVSIEQFDAEGNHLATIAEEGGGPGELSSYFRLKGLGNDTVLVGQQSLQRVYYAPGDDGIYAFERATVPQEIPDRTINFIGPQSDTAYYASGGRVIRDIQTAAKNEVDYNNSAIALVDPSGEMLRDSLYLLKNATPHFTQTEGGGIRVNSVPFRYNDRFVLLGDGNYLIARPDSNVISIYNNEQQLQKSITLNIKPRPVTAADLDYELEDVDSKIRSEIETRVQDQKPPYLNVYATDKHIWLHTNTGTEGKEMVVLDYDGNAIGKFMLPEVDLIKEIKDNRVYTIHRSPTKGDIIRVYKIAF